MKSAIFAALALASLALPASAQTAQWPPAQVTIVVPFAAGSTPDIIARLLADKFKERTGKVFLLENRPGAGGNLGVAAVAKGPADGSVLGIGLLGGLGMNKLLMKSMPYDPDKEIVAVTILTEQPSVLAVSNEMGVSTVKELVAKLAKDPGKYNFSSIGQGSLSHLSMELVANKSGTKVTHLPMKSSPEAAMAVMRNDVQMTVLPAVSVLQFGKEGKLKILAVTSEKRSLAMPDVPTFRESGVEGVVAAAWNALVAPASVPKAVLDQINAHTVAALNDPAIRENFSKQIMEPTPMTPEQAKAYVAAELVKWAAIVKAAGIQPQ